MTANEKLANRFVELLAERADWHGQKAPRWATLTSTWRGILTETVSVFLGELGDGVNASGGIDDRSEDEHVREACEQMTTLQRLKTYRQLYALGCRISGVDQAIERLARSHS